MNTIRIAVATVLLATPTQVLPALAGAAEPHDHWQVVEKICQTGLTPEVTSGHEEFVAAWDQKGTLTEVTHLAEYTGFRPRVFTRNVRTEEGPHASQLGRPVSLDMQYAKCFQAR